LHADATVALALPSDETHDPIDVNIVLRLPPSDDTPAMMATATDPRSTHIRSR
jgi:hypothetical protein